jgi:hypothetical protein
MLLVASSSFVMKNSPENQIKLESSNNLEFSNQTGSGATQAQVTSFINYINSASTFFRDDTQSRLNYIADQMNSSYGSDGYGFSIVQQGNASCTWAILTYNSVYASVAPGVDRIYPTYSYMFLKEPIYSGRAYLYGTGQKGSGINSTLEAVIKNVILSVETESSCLCYSGDSRSIATKLNEFDNGTWNVFCSAYNSMFANVYVYNNKYVYTRPKTCYYVVYEM